MTYSCPHFFNIIPLVYTLRLTAIHVRQRNRMPTAISSLCRSSSIVVVDDIQNPLLLATDRVRRSTAAALRRNAIFRNNGRDHDIAELSPKVQRAGPGAQRVEIGEKHNNTRCCRCTA